MTEKEKNDFEEKLLSNVMDQFYGIVLEAQKPMYKALRIRTANLMATLAVLAVVSITGLFGIAQYNKVKAVFDTPDQIKKSTEDLLSQIKDGKRESIDTFETKAGHYKDTEEIKELVKKGEGERNLMLQAINKQGMQLESQGSQLTNINNSVQSLQNAINLRNLKNSNE